ncbi:26S proteasome non-ATPase regulatory subunit 2 [Lepeophtheirus salmonis]|uniref:26S proteasome non-ATPase regulatory subunit 2 n=1 Tax=Lepeophtheirus salmonis TaxID=72036 RepID=UPI001AEA523D|nr:26S proteasome non-ATPase regulatory subunit 2-like [Lepeophtheirus salmonis]
MTPKKEEEDVIMKEEVPTPKKKKEDEKKDGKDGKDEELSEEDKRLKEDLELFVERLESDGDVSAITGLRELIRASTTSMTSVPKPLKFLRPHYSRIEATFEKMSGPNKENLSDVLSVLSMTEDVSKRMTLKYKLKGVKNVVDLWGHEYVRHLSAEIVSAWNEDDETQEDVNKDALLGLVKNIMPYQMKHHAEAEACDLLMEVEKMDLILDFVDNGAYNRVCLYLTSCVPYVPSPENIQLLETSVKIFRKFEQYPRALRLALQLNRPELVLEIFMSCKDPIMQKQLAYMLSRQQHYIELDEDEFDEINEILSNSHLNGHFLNLARELDIMEPKTPEDVYKSHLDNIRNPFGGSSVDSGRHNLASSFVNGFVNAAFGTDKLIVDEGSKWIHKNKEHGMMSAMASLGMILLWDVDGGLLKIDKYLYSLDEPIKAGALLACGIVNAGVRNDCDPALALLSDYVLHKSEIMRCGAIFGLGLAYAGSNRKDVISLLLPVFGDEKVSMEIIGITALACGLIAVGSCNSEVTSTILQVLMEKKESDLKDPFAKFLPLGIGLCYLGKQEMSEATVAALEAIPKPFNFMATTLVDICAYAGTGNVLKIQELLHICSEHHEETSKDTKKSSSKKDDDKKDDKDSSQDLSMQQAVAVLGLALVAMGEDIGSEMLFRTFGHLLRYCEPVIRRTVPLALGLISVSNPQLIILDTLSKFSHDSDPEVAHNSIFAMGLIGAGTNNARLSAMLRQLAQYHSKDHHNLFMVRIAQGLLHMGKGTLTLNPYHSDNQLMSPVAVAGLLGTIMAFLDVKQTILSKSHYLLFGLCTAMQPRMLVTFDENLSPLTVSVRVGQAVDVVGQAGKPKTITGFQTHTTPVLLSCGERAELATEEYIPMTPIMEGFVILKKNPNY